MKKKSKEEVLEQSRREIDPVTYNRIRDLWKHHSICEDHRDVAGILTTLAAECKYEVVNTEHVWSGREGAAQFYKALLTAIPDAKFELQEIAIGPQGVFEEAILTGTHRGAYLNYAPTNRPIALTVGIFFPWDPKSGLFLGERIYANLDKLLG